MPILVENYTGQGSNMQRHLFSFILALFLTGITTGLYSQQIDRVEGSPYPYSKQPDTLYVVDDTKLDSNQQFVLQSLQGLLARKRPRIYRINNEGSLMWLSEMHSRYRVYMNETYVNDYLGLVKYFKDEIDGYILCTTAGSSANAALSLCAKYNAIAVPDNLEQTFSFLPKLLDVSTWTEEDVYLKYHDSLSKNILVYEREDKEAFMGDYTVFANAFRFYEPVGSQFTGAAIEDMNTDAALFGATSDNDLVTLASQKSVLLHNSDHATNLSVLTNFGPRFQQQEGQTVIDTLNPNIHTVCFLMSGGENIQWLLNTFATSKKWYNSDGRGFVPLGWTVSPALAELAPPALKYFYDNASSGNGGRDYFVAAPSGIGYMYADKYRDITTYTDLLNKYMAKADLRIVNVVGTMRNPDMLAYAQCSNVDGIFYYHYPDFSDLHGKLMWINGTPIISPKFALWENKETPQSLASKINNEVKNQYQPDGFSLIAVDSKNFSVDDVRNCVSLLDNDVRVVAPDDFVRLIKRNLGIFLYQNAPNPFTDKTKITFKVSYAQDVNLSIYDVNGDLMYTIYDGKADAGLTTVEFSRTDAMITGIYICTLATANQSASIKMQVEF